MKKNKKTFAARAQDILKKYKRADFDEIERNAMESELEALQQEQEVYKQTSNIGQDFKCGGKMYQNGGELNYLEPISGEIPTIENELTQESSSQELSPYKTSTAPSYISAGASALGNILLANQAKKRAESLNLPRIEAQKLTAPEISLERSRQLARREATKGAQRAKYAAKQGARSRGQYASTRAATEANLAGKLGDVLSQTYEKEALINANMKAGMSKTNAELAARAQMANQQAAIQEQMMKAQAMKERDAYLAGAIDVIPQATRDIRAQKAQDMMINTLGDKYGWYMDDIPDAKWYQRKQRPVIKYRG